MHYRRGQLTPEALRGLAELVAAGWLRADHRGRVFYWEVVDMPAIRQVAGLPYRPRLSALIRAEAAAVRGTPATLGGCVLSAARGRIWVDREPAAVAGRGAPAPGPWDGRWRIDGPPDRGLTLAALGPAGLGQCPGWRKAGLRRRAILTAPGVWDGPTLVAAPTLPGIGPRAPDWSSQPLWDILAFHDEMRLD